MCKSLAIVTAALGVVLSPYVAHTVTKHDSDRSLRNIVSEKFSKDSVYIGATSFFSATPGYRLPDENRGSLSYTVFTTSGVVG